MTEGSIYLHANLNEILCKNERLMIHVAVGTGVPDCPQTEAIFTARRNVCNGQSGTPVPTF